ncbi:MAG: hypothetical protein IJD46_02865 [Bacilli bacterium]|nr:hypothetical protein [Bacilli bacterium]
MARKKETTIANKKSVNPGIKKLKLLVTIVNRSKATYYIDLLEQFEVNMQLVIYGKGTANSEMRDLLGIVETDKVVLISFVREDKVNDVLETLKEKFDKIKNGNGIAYTIPMNSIIGVSIYQFLSNNKTMKKEEK